MGAGDVVVKCTRCERDIECGVDGFGRSIAVLESGVYVRDTARGRGFVPICAGCAVREQDAKDEAWWKAHPGLSPREGAARMLAESGWLVGEKHRDPA